MTEALRWPAEVIHAVSKSFSRPITGYLLAPRLWGVAVAGHIYMDALGRFADGALISTSAITDLCDEQDYLVADTLSGNCYVLVFSEASDRED